MVLEEFKEELNYVDASRKNRLKYAYMVLKDMSLFPKLITILYMTNDRVSCRAAWIFEYVCTQNIYSICPYLDLFTSNLEKIYMDSAVRPVAKVCEILAKEKYSKEHNTIKTMLKPQHKERIIEACFDWMINKNKTAPKVYAMTTLFLFGQDYKWVHPELMDILERDFNTQTPGFKARAKHILKKIKK